MLGIADWGIGRNQHRRGEVPFRDEFLRGSAHESGCSAAILHDPVLCGRDEALADRLPVRTFCISLLLLATDARLPFTITGKTVMPALERKSWLIRFF